MAQMKDINEKYGCKMIILSDSWILKILNYESFWMYKGTVRTVYRIEAL